MTGDLASSVRNSMYEGEVSLSFQESSMNHACNGNAQSWTTITVIARHLGPAGSPHIHGRFAFDQESGFLKRPAPGNPFVVTGGISLLQGELEVWAWESGRCPRKCPHDVQLRYDVQECMNAVVHQVIFVRIYSDPCSQGLTRPG
jgi:hypothetical protein